MPVPGAAMNGPILNAARRTLGRTAPRMARATTSAPAPRPPRNSATITGGPAGQASGRPDPAAAKGRAAEEPAGHGPAHASTGYHSACRLVSQAEFISRTHSRAPCQASRSPDRLSQRTFRAILNVIVTSSNKITTGASGRPVNCEFGREPTAGAPPGLGARSRPGDAGPARPRRRGRGVISWGDRGQVATPQRGPRAMAARAARLSGRTVAAARPRVADPGADSSCLGAGSRPVAIHFVFARFPRVRAW